MQYSSGEVVEIGDIVTYLDPLGRVDENGEIVHDTPNASGEPSMQR